MHVTEENRKKVAFSEPITQELLGTIATYMDDMIREQLHGTTEDPTEFLIAYLDKDPRFEELLASTFGLFKE